MASLLWDAQVFETLEMQKNNHYEASKTQEKNYDCSITLYTISVDLSALKILISTSNLGMRATFYILITQSLILRV